MEKGFKLQFKAQNNGELLREAISRQGISKKGLTAIKYNGGKIFVNGEERTVRYILTQGDTITLIFPPEEFGEGLIVEHGKLNIIYEDDALLILEKPPFINTIPSREHPTVE